MAVGVVGRCLIALVGAPPRGALTPSDASSARGPYRLFTIRITIRMNAISNATFVQLIG